MDRIGKQRISTDMDEGTLMSGQYAFSLINPRESFRPEGGRGAATMISDEGFIF